MRNFTKWAIAAAAVVVAAGSASAQMLKAEVPFAFHTAGGTMQPGTYQVHVGHDGIVSWLNLDTRKGALTKPAGPEYPKAEWKDSDTPRLVFECRDGECGLLTLYLADGNPALRFYGLKSKAGQTRIAMVPLTVVKR